MMKHKGDWLLLLAAFDLINGVANDAVNFLNSAIGSNIFWIGDMTRFR